MKKIILLIFCLCILWIPPLHAQETAIEEGISWLIANQDPSGLWGTDKQTPFKDAAVVLNILGQHNADSNAIANGLGAISTYQVLSNDYLARRIMALRSCGIDIPDEYINELASSQNDDGGWGFRSGYGSNMLETALALSALKKVDYSGTAVFSGGIIYLISGQNTDGGWSFSSGDSSRVYHTCQAVLALTILSDEFDVADELDDAVIWLKSQVHGDGGLGTGGISNAYETGMALAAIAKNDPLADEVANAGDYLDSSRLVDGSWNSDAYSTALAIYGLKHMGPDLAVYESDIYLSNPTPGDSETVTIFADIINNGVLAADSVLVQIFDGDPEDGGYQIGSDFILESLAAGDDETIQAEWDTYQLAGLHKIYVLVDPQGNISEPDKQNNTVYKNVYVYLPPDLLIADNGITFEPQFPEPAEDVTIKVTVKNNGETTASSVALQVYDGDPGAGGTALMGSPYIISSIGSGSQFTLQLNMGSYFSSEGAYDIYAWTDQDGEIREVSDSNNLNSSILCVGFQMRTLNLKTGLNLISPPLEPTGSLNSYSIMPEIQYCEEITGWNLNLQQWQSAFDVGGGIFVGDNFDLILREGFFARVTDESEWNAKGDPVETHECINLDPGFNIISVPNEDACYSGYGLLDNTIYCTEAHNWNADIQAWESAFKIDDTTFAGQDFSVYSGCGYFLKLTEDDQFCSETCDTIVYLPDLLITSSDISISPNPANSGDTVALYVNIQNIGNDTAFTPRLDIFAGHPDSGGQHLMGGYLPVDLPPSTSSGYYGGNFIFTGSGNINIYGVADYYEETEEQNESNNIAGSTLQIIPALLAGMQNTGNIGSRSIGVRLSLNDELPAGVSQNIPVSLNDPLAMKGLNNIPVSQSASSISNVLVGNVTSSSASIAWITDRSAGGYINYGETSALGLSCGENTSGTETHILTLTNLKPAATYFFEVISGGISDNNNGQYYSFTTANSGFGIPSLVYGKVRNSDQAVPCEAIASCKVMGEPGESLPLLGKAESGGFWSFNLGNLKDAVSRNTFTAEAGNTLLLEFYMPDKYLKSYSLILSGQSPLDCGIFEIGIAVLCGDADLSGSVNVSDAVILINYLFCGDDRNICMQAADVDCNGLVNLQDVVYLINYIFKGGDYPCDGC